ncbi:MAG: hypothetical protein MJ252_12385 [archaeon]|nr:hypothetical protein [archaeon]
MIKKILLLLFLISLSKSDHIALPFLSNFIKNSTAPLEIPDKCMNTPTFNLAVTKFMVSTFVYKDIADVILQAYTAYSEYNEYCSDLNFTVYLDTITPIIERLQNKSDILYYLHFFQAFPPYLNSTLKVYNEFHNLTYEEIGANLGNTIKFFFDESKKLLEHSYQPIRNLRGRNLKSKIINDDLIFEIVAGFAQGLSNSTDYLCKYSIIDNRVKLTEIVHKVIELYQDDYDILEILDAILPDIISLLDFASNCRIIELIQVIKDTATPEGFEALKQRFEDNLASVIQDIVGMIKSAIGANYPEVGINLGKLVGLLLDFYVN